jgi:hypothetical protein
LQIDAKFLHLIWIEFPFRTNLIEMTETLLGSQTASHLTQESNQPAIPSINAYSKAFIATLVSWPLQFANA